MRAFPPRHLLTQPEINESKRMVQLWSSVNHGVSLGLNLIVVLVIYFAKLKRHPVLLSFFAAILVSDVFNLLLVRHPDHPNWNLCLISQAGTTGSTALVTTAAMSMVVVVWSLLRDRASKKVMGRGFVPLLLALPWAAFTGIFVMSIVTTAYRGDLVPEVTTCYAYNFFTNVSHAVAVLSVVVAIGFNIWGIVLFVRNRMSSRSLVGNHSEDLDVRQALGSAQPGLGLNRGFTLRVLIFGVSLIAGLGASLVIIFAPESYVPALFQASLGLICLILFGSQRDIIDAVFSSPSNPSSLLHKLSTKYRSGMSAPPHPQPWFEVTTPSRHTSLVHHPRTTAAEKDDIRMIPALSALGVGEAWDTTSSSTNLRTPSYALSRLSFGAMSGSSPRPELSARESSTKREGEEEQNEEAIGVGWAGLSRPEEESKEVLNGDRKDEKDKDGAERVTDVKVRVAESVVMDGMDSSGSSKSIGSGRSNSGRGSSRRTPS